MKHLASTCSILPLLLCAAGAAQAQDSWGDQLSRAVTEGKASVDFRYRYENVDQDGFDDDADASTLRSRLTLETAPLNGFTALLEVDDVSSIGVDDYNSTENGKGEYPVVADPEGTDVNQAWLKYTGTGFDGTYGRQRILHGSQRFIGGVGWRQNEQTYDGFRAHWSPIEILTVDASYVYNVNRIFGPDDGANPSDLEGDNYFLRADYKITPDHTISAFGYLLDFDSQNGYAAGKTVNNSSDTYGVEYQGKFDWFSVALSWADQSDAGDSQLDYDAQYYLVELGATFQAVNVTVGYEVLGTGDGVGFSTPLATLHKFQGWADMFLATPGDGIEDTYLSIGGSAGPVNLQAVYHDFQAEDSNADFGTELDLVATWPINKQFSVQAKYAAFDTDNRLRYADTDKAWVTLQLKL
ncbi:MAG: alginate export family protein [Halioglobus sp.]|nr:alginate export family protein [Halioglobus sp.]